MQLSKIYTWKNSLCSTVPFYRPCDKVIYLIISLKQTAGLGQRMKLTLTHIKSKRASSPPHLRFPIKCNYMVWFVALFVSHHPIAISCMVDHLVWICCGLLPLLLSWWMSHANPVQILQKLTKYLPLAWHILQDDIWWVFLAWRPSRIEYKSAFVLWVATPFTNLVVCQGWIISNYSETNNFILVSWWWTSVHFRYCTCEISAMK